MVSDMPSRRAVLVAGGGLLGSAVAGRLAVSRGSSSPDAFEAAWPMARHNPAGTSYASGIDGPSDDVEVRWTHTVEDTGFRAPTPIVADGHVYVAGRGLVAVDADDGTEQFRYPESSIAPPAVARAAAYRTPTVVMADRQTIGIHGRGGPSLLGRRPATDRWTAGKTDDADFFSGATETPPVAVDGTVLAYTAGGLSAIDASSGTIRWQTERTHGRPVVRDGTVYALSLGFVNSFDLATGAHSTVARLDDAPRSVTATPDRLLVYTHEALIAISYDGTIQWEYTHSEDPSLEEIPPAVADGVAYVSFSVDGEDRILALDTSDRTVLWEAPFTVRESAGYGPSLAVSDSMVYLPTESQGIVALDRSDGRVRWQFDVDTSLSWSSVTLDAGRVYAFVDRTLYALEEA